MDDNEKNRIVQLTNDDINDMMMVVALVRGIVLNALTHLERTIDGFLSSHFTVNTAMANELLNNVFASKYVTFESKRMIFNTLIQNHHNEYKEKNMKSIHANLEKFNNHRNILAHCIVDVKKSAYQNFKNTKEITFLKFDKEIKEEKYTIDSANSIATEIYNFIEPIHKLIKHY